MAIAAFNTTVLECTHCDARVMGVLPCNCCDFTELAYWAFGMQTWKGNKTYCRDCLASTGYTQQAANRAYHFNKKRFQCCGMSMASLTFIAKDGTSHCMPPPPPPVASDVSTLPPHDLASSSKHVSKDVSEEMQTQRMNILTLQAFQQSLDRIKEDVHQVLGELVSLNGRFDISEEVHAESYNLQKKQIESVLSVASRLHEVEKTLKLPTALTPRKCIDRDEEEGELWVDEVGQASIL